MPLDNEQIEAMANWTLEDFQEDPLAAVEQVRELATSYLALQGDRDAAVADIYHMGGCPNCIHNIGRSENTGLPICEIYREYPNGECFEWRGPQPEQVLAPADQRAGEYADNPVLAQA